MIMEVDDRWNTDSDSEGDRDTQKSPENKLDDNGGEKVTEIPQSPEKKDDDDGGEQRDELAKLRRRWELATVLDFLTVYEELIGKGLKIKAEEIEEGLISPNSSLDKLHIALLKGIPPVHKSLDGSDKWITVLCKKLDPWWPWVAEGEIPLKVAKGEEISRYKELSVMNRLLLLRALCEIRAEQDDAVVYINEALKQGTEISSFRKDKIAGDQNGNSFWYEGNTATGPRLYKGVIFHDTSEKSVGKECSSPHFEWETLATSLKEFRKIVDDFSSSNVAAETAVRMFIETEAIPTLEKFQMLKERAEKNKQRRQAMLLIDRRPVYTERATRSCRTRKPVNYSYDDYDRVIKEAIGIKVHKTKTEEQHGEETNDSDSGDSPRKNNKVSEDGSSKRVSSEDDRAVDKPGKRKNEASESDNDYSFSGKEVVVSDSDFSDSGNSKPHGKSIKQVRHFGVRWSSRLAGGESQSFADNRNTGTKNRLRQRPTLNSAIAGSIVIPDSEDDNDH